MLISKNQQTETLPSTEIHSFMAETNGFRYQLFSCSNGGLNNQWIAPIYKIRFEIVKYLIYRPRLTPLDCSSQPKHKDI